MLGICDHCDFMGDCITDGGHQFRCSECNETPEICLECKTPCRDETERKQWIRWLETRVPGDRFIGGRIPTPF